MPLDDETVILLKNMFGGNRPNQLVAEVSHMRVLAIAAAAGFFGDRLKYVFKFGHNPDIDPIDNYEDIWWGGGTYRFYPATAVACEVVSGNAGDDVGGIGAQGVEVQGLDNDGNVKTATVELNGLAPVAIGSFKRIFRAKALNPGGDPSQTNIGAITAREIATPTNIGAVIGAGKGQTLQAIYTVPAGYKAVVLGGHVSTGKAMDAEIELMIREPGGAWQVKVHQDVVAAQIELDGCVVGIAPALSDIRVRALTTTQNSHVSADFHVLMIRETAQ